MSAPESGHHTQVTQGTESSIPRGERHKKPRNGKVFVGKKALRPQEAAEWEEARDAFGDLTHDPNLTPEEAARIYYRRYPDHPPDELHDTKAKRRAKMWRMFNLKTKPAAKLFGCLDRPHVYTLHAEHLGLSAVHSHPKYLRSPENVKAWRDAIKRHLKPTLWWKLEANTRIHAHVVASQDAGLLQIRRGGEVIKPVHDPEGLITYLSKPSAPYTEEHLAYLMVDRRVVVTQLPRLSGFYGLPNRRTWGA